MCQLLWLNSNSAVELLLHEEILLQLFFFAFNRKGIHIIAAIAETRTEMHIE